ncbi:hypothetical protein AWH66_2017840 [Vibrio barjaei]|nr:hypothetical protein AWH66_2017840 [Vibrio barjaei]
MGFKYLRRIVDSEIKTNNAARAIADITRINISMSICDRKMMSGEAYNFSGRGYEDKITDLRSMK